MKGTIIKALAGFYYVACDHVIYTCKARGKFRKTKQKPLVGDHVEFSVDDNEEGYIMKLLPPAVGTSIKPLPYPEKTSFFIASSW